MMKRKTVKRRVKKKSNTSHEEIRKIREQLYLAQAKLSELNGHFSQLKRLIFK